jgi:hypothetical protein
MMQSQNYPTAKPDVSVEAISNRDSSLSEQQRKAVTKTLAQIEANPTFVFYCYEYGQEWWPGKHL